MQWSMFVTLEIATRIAKEIGVKNGKKFGERLKGKTRDAVCEVPHSHMFPANFHLSRITIITFRIATFFSFHFLNEKSP